MDLIEQKTRLFLAFFINLPTFAGYLPVVYVVSGNGIFTISNFLRSSYHFLRALIFIIKVGYNT